MLRRHWLSTSQAALRSKNSVEILSRLRLLRQWDTADGEGRVTDMGGVYDSIVPYIMQKFGVQLDTTNGG